MRIPGAKSLRLTGRRLRSRLQPGAIVLGYHRIADQPDDPFGLCVSPGHFAEQLEAIREIGEVRSLSDLVRHARTGSLPKRAVAITFDDGYADFLGSALPALHQFGCPATIFVVSAALGTEFWWDRLPWSSITTAADSYQDSGARSLAELHRRFRTLSAEERELELKMMLGPVTVAANDSRCVTAEELRMLASDVLIEVGGHSRTHPWMPSLGEHRRREEIYGCKRDLEEIIGHPVSGFSFPYGGTSSALRDQVCSAGYTFACDSGLDVLRSRSDPFAIPRLWVRDEDGDAFARWLRVWLHG